MSLHFINDKKKILARYIFQIKEKNAQVHATFFSHIVEFIVLREPSFSLILSLFKNEVYMIRRLSY